MNTPTPSPLPTGPLTRWLLDPDDMTRELLRAVRHFLALGIAWAIRIAIVLAIVWAATRILSALRSRRMTSEGRTLRILPPPQTDPDGALVLWMGLHALLRPAWRRIVFGQPHLSWELAASGGDAWIALWVPRDVPPGLAERAVESAWPGARAQQANDEVRPQAGELAACELVLVEPEMFPIGEGVGDDPLRLTLGALGLLDPRERAIVQVLVRPATLNGRYRLRKQARRLRRQQNTRVASTRARPVGPPDPAVDADVRAILSKASSPLWEVSVRVGVRSPERKAARGKIHALAGAFAVFDGRNSFTRKRLLGAARKIAQRSFHRGYLLSAPELARIANLPSPDALPSLDRAKARTVAPPKDLVPTGKVLGVSDHPGYERVVAIAPEDAHHHVHLIGETGTGKSTLIARMVLADAAAGRAAVVIDPKGDLVRAITERLPRDAVERTCLIDPDDRRHAVGLNVLEGAEDPDLVVEQVGDIFFRLFERHWGPRTDDILRAACHTLIQVPGSTLADVPKLLLSHDWRTQIREKHLLRNAPAANLFWDWYESLPAAQRSTNIAPLMNKLRLFVMSERMLAIVGQGAPRLNIPRFLDSGGLLLVRIPKGTIGENTSRLLGAFVVARVWQAAMGWAARPEQQRPSVTLYVDEMHNYLALPRSFEDMLAEARGYKLALVLAHQHMGQLPRGMREALAANARTKIAFTCSPEDAHLLERQFAPHLSSHDLANLATYQAACRPCVAGGHGAAFTFRTEALAPPEGHRAKEVKKTSNAAFAAERSKIAALLASKHAYIDDLDRVGARAAGYRQHAGGRT